MTPEEVKYNQEPILGLISFLAHIWGEEWLKHIFLSNLAAANNTVSPIGKQNLSAQYA